MKWYQKTWVIVVLCVFCFPVGLFLMWKSPNLKLSHKILISIIAGIFIAAGSRDEIEKEKIKMEKQDELRKAELLLKQDQERYKQKIKENLNKWEENLRNGTYERIINKCAKKPSEYLKGKVGRKGEMSGPIVVLRNNDGNAVYVPQNTSPDSYKRPTEGVRYSFFYNGYEQERLYHKDKRNVIIFAEYVGILYVGTYEKLGDVHERISRIYVIDTDSEELIAFHETGIATDGYQNNPPGKLSASYESKKRESDGRLYIDTYLVYKPVDINDSDILHINRFFKLVLER